MNIKIYVVFAANGVMIHRDYKRACYCRDHYFKSPHVVRKYSTVAEANKAATDHLWDIAPLDRCIPEVLEINKLYYANKLPRND